MVCGRTQRLARAPRRAGPNAGLRGAAARPGQSRRFCYFPARRRLHLSSSSSTGYKGVVDMGSQRLTLGGKPFKAQATCGHIRPLGYFATRLEAAVCYSRWFDSDRHHEAEARSISGDSSQRAAPVAYPRAHPSYSTTIPKRRGSAKQRRRFKKRRGEPSQGETAAADDDNGDKCDDSGSHTEDNEDE